MIHSGIRSQQTASDYLDESDRLINGVNLVSYIQDSTAIPHPYLFWQRGNSKAIASPEWKVVWNEEFGDTLVYNLMMDPNEMTDQYTVTGYGIRVTDSLKRELQLPFYDLIRIHQEWSSGLPGPLWPAIVHFREEVDGRWFYFDN